MFDNCKTCKSVPIHNYFVNIFLSKFSAINIIILALAVFVRSPAAYKALKSFSILQLPSRATLQAYTGDFLHEAGAAVESIGKQVEVYRIFQQSC